MEETHELIKKSCQLGREGGKEEKRYLLYHLSFPLSKAMLVPEWLKISSWSCYSRTYDKRDIALNNV